MAFLKFLLIILLVFYLLKLLGRMFAPYLAKTMAKKMEHMMKEQYQQKHAPEQKVGETVVDKQPAASTKKSNKDVGEYIDFEEIN
ncbi:MAG: DUF4834 family protein [Flavobacteriaceae bacterium]|nr:DUF4834 family protein [Flavobacteriaceae bacterium]